MPKTIYFRSVELVTRVPKVSSELNIIGVQTYLTHPQIFTRKQKSRKGKCNKKNVHRLHAMYRYN